MSVMFSAFKLGNLDLANRFVHSATYEGLAAPDGEVTDGLLKRYRKLASGEVGLIIPGYMFTHPLGKAQPFQTGIHSDSMIEGLERLTDTVHEQGGKIVFQLAHSGQQTTKQNIGQTPLGPSDTVRDAIDFFKPRAMSEAQIEEAIESFVRAAQRAGGAGADGVQLHAAHGYLINQFLSPFFNHRTDRWGGSDENRFRFLSEAVDRVRAVLPPGMPLLVKLNAIDHTPRTGVTLEQSVRYAGWLARAGIDALEVSCGSAVFAFMNTCRGEVPVKELVQSLPWWKKPIGRMMMGKLVGQYDLEEGYNLEAAGKMKPAIGDTPLILVGGLRTLNRMNDAVENGPADLISMSRPFIREPTLVKRFREGKATRVSCISCNKCIAALPNHMPVYCYTKGFPKQ